MAVLIKDGEEVNQCDDHDRLGIHLTQRQKDNRARLRQSPVLAEAVDRVWRKNGRRKSFGIDAIDPRLGRRGLDRLFGRIKRVSA